MKVKQCNDTECNLKDKCKRFTNDANAENIAKIKHGFFNGFPEKHFCQHLIMKTK